MFRRALFTLLATTACTTPPPDGTAGDASFVTSGGTTTGTAVATPVFVYDSDGDGHLGYLVDVYRATDLPVGSPCDTARAPQSQELARISIVTLQYGSRAEIAPGAVLPVWDDLSDPSFKHTADYVSFEVGHLSLAPGSMHGSMSVTDFDGSYIDATFDAVADRWARRYPGDASRVSTHFTGTIRAGICGSQH